MKPTTADLRATWDQLLDGAPVTFATACRNIGDAAAVAASILREECGEASASAVARLALGIMEREQRLARDPAIEVARELAAAARAREADAAAKGRDGDAAFHAHQAAALEGLIDSL